MNIKNLKQIISDVRKSFDNLADALPDADYFDCLTDGHDWNNALSELDQVSNAIYELEKIDNSDIVSIALDIRNEKPYGSEDIKDWHNLDMTYCDSSQFDGDGYQTEYYKDEKTGRSFTLEFKLDDARTLGIWKETTGKDINSI